MVVNKIGMCPWGKSRGTEVANICPARLPIQFFTFILALVAVVESMFIAIYERVRVEERLNGYKTCFGVGIAGMPGGWWRSSIIWSSGEFDNWLFPPSVWILLVETVWSNGLMHVYTPRGNNRRGGLLAVRI